MFLTCEQKMESIDDLIDWAEYDEDQENRVRSSRPKVPYIYVPYIKKKPFPFKPGVERRFRDQDVNRGFRGNPAKAKRWWPESGVTIMNKPPPMGINRGFKKPFRDWRKKPFTDPGDIERARTARFKKNQQWIRRFRGANRLKQSLHNIRLERARDATWRRKQKGLRLLALEKQDPAAYKKYWYERNARKRGYQISKPFKRPAGWLPPAEYERQKQARLIRAYAKKGLYAFNPQIDYAKHSHYRVIDDFC